MLICHDSHPLGARKRVPWRALAPYPLIVAGEVSANRALLDAALGALAPRAHYEVQRSSTALGLVAEGVAPPWCRGSWCRRARIRASA